VSKTVLMADVDYGDVVHICENLRERDIAEIFATRWDNDVHKLAEEIWAYRECAWVAYTHDGEPAAIMGCHPILPGSKVWTIFGFGTPRWSDVIVALSRQALRFCKPMMKNAGANRVSCYALSTHHDARKWVQFLGMHEEATHKMFGKDGEDFVVYVWFPNMTKDSADVR